MLITPPRNTPPLDQPVRLNRASMQANGLIFAMLDGLVLKDFARGATLVPTGPRTQVHTMGRGLGFGTKFGTGAADNLTLPDLAAGGTARTIAAWLYANGSGGGSLGRIMDSAAQITWRVSDASNLLFTQGWSGGGGGVSFSYPHTADNTWHLHVVTCSSPSSYATYIDGVAQTMTGTSSTTGTLLGSTSVLLGNRVSPQDRNWDGMFGPVLIYDRGLSPAEVWQMWAPQTRWELYAPTRQRLYAPAASGSPTLFRRSLTSRAGSRMVA